MSYTHKQTQDMIKLADYHLGISFDDQVLKTIEELSSLIKMLCKYALKEIDYEDFNLLDELYDADYMIFQMKRALLKDEYTKVIFNQIVDAKLERELKRWGLNE